MGCIIPLSLWFFSLVGIECGGVGTQLPPTSAWGGMQGAQTDHPRNAVGVSLGLVSMF